MTSNHGNPVTIPPRLPSLSTTASLTLGVALFLLVVAGVMAYQRGIPQERVEILRQLPHDPQAFTQGLIFHEGHLYESTGTYGGSSLKLVRPETGEVIRQQKLPAVQFGEGLALVENRLILLTWREGVASVYGLEDFVPLSTFFYSGEGWGLCFDGRDLWMTSGGSTLLRRDPHTFAILGQVQIRQGLFPLSGVNELECVGPHIYGNVYKTDRIVRIDKDSGAVVAEIDASALNGPSRRPSASVAVLNGIAWNPDSETFFLTGKFWPSLFEVRFVPR
jgi:glutaminyl-peptide cyclotransferase